jgi:hypothetical protein
LPRFAEDSIQLSVVISVGLLIRGGTSAVNYLREGNCEIDATQVLEARCDVPMRLDRVLEGGETSTDISLLS